MTQPVSEAPASERSHLSRKWTLKIGIIGLALFALGLWGVWDATIKFPNNGGEAAEYLEYQYLKEMGSDRRDFAASIPSASDQRTPSQRLHDLDEKMAQGTTLSGADRQLHDWLDQLKIIGRLEPAEASTQIPRTDFRKDEHGQKVQVKDSGQRLADLRTKWSAGNPPAPLSTHDIHMQWLIAVSGLGFGGWMLFLLVAARARVYRWDAAEQRLTFPDGTSVVPADIAEFDKRKWHKLFITLKVKPGHPQLGGKGIEIDLLRFEPVEEWVLTMERAAFPENADVPPSPPPATSASTES